MRQGGIPHAVEHAFGVKTWENSSKVGAFDLFLLAVSFCCFAALLALDCAEFARSDAVLDSCTVLAPVHGEGSIFRSIRKSVAPELQNQDKQFWIYVAQIRSVFGCQYSWRKFGGSCHSPLAAGAHTPLLRLAQLQPNEGEDPWRMRSLDVLLRPHWFPRLSSLSVCLPPKNTPSLVIATVPQVDCKWWWAGQPSASVCPMRSTVFFLELLCLPFLDGHEVLPQCIY